MQASVVYWLSANYRASGAAVAMDASPADDDAQCDEEAGEALDAAV
jgi:hypothetical protein